MRHALRAEINITPLVDVCLVLLIIMMVVTPLVHGHGEVELPEASAPPLWPAEPTRSKITLSYGPPPAIALDEDPGPLSVPALEALLGALHAGNPRREIVIRADRRVRYGDVRTVLRAVQGAGFTTVGLVAERRRPPR
jgi:biopolymer transport protein TolR